MKELAFGGSGIVFAATFVPSGRKVAVKTILPQKNNLSVRQKLKYLKSEIDLLKSFDHPNIIQLIHSDKGDLSFALELAEGGDLENRLSRRGALPENTAKHIFRQVVDGVCYLHDEHVIHHDIKLENILLMSRRTLPVAKLTDFGFSRRFNERTSRVEGDLSYCAPEKLKMLFSCAHKMSQSPEKVDIYSVGISLFTACTNQSSHCAKNFIGIYNESKNVNFVRELADKMSADFSANCISFMMQCLVFDEKSRPSAKYLQSHAWFAAKKFRSFCS